jgi:hypothetical protein
MKKVAIVQSEEFFTSKLQKKYLEGIPLLTSDNFKKVYAFIIKNAQKKCIFNFILDINSGVLDKLIDYISLKKKSNSKNVSVLNKCIFMATRSNATSIREKKNLKDMNIYFTLTTIGEILKDYYDNRIFVISDSKTPYYDEIYRFKNSNNSNNNYRLSELTVGILNEYKGGTISCALNTESEYKKYVDLILESNYRKILQFIEVNYLGILKPLENVMFSLNNINAGSGIVGNFLEYPGLSILNIYENTSLMLAYQTTQWNSFIKNKLVSNKISNYGKLINLVRK